jgi:hypothetical protein
MIYTNEKDVQVKVMYKVKGQEYGFSEGQIPFDEAIVPAGESVDLGDAKVTKTIDFPDMPAEEVTYSGG